MKPRYTVRLTGDLAAAEREQVAQRVAGITDIESDKIVRLLDRGRGRDLIKPSSANVANRLASVLAEAGAPVQLVPVETESTAGETAAPPRDVDGHDAHDDGLHSRPSAVAREDGSARGAGARAAEPAQSARDQGGEDRSAASPGEEREERVVAQEAAAPPAAVPEETAPGAPVAESTTPEGSTPEATRPEPSVPKATTPEDSSHESVSRESVPRDPGLQHAAPGGVARDEERLQDGARNEEGPDRSARDAGARDEGAAGGGFAEPDAGDARDVAAAPPRRAEPLAEPEPERAEASAAAAGDPAPRAPQPVDDPQRRTRARNGAAFLGAVGAATLGIGAFLALDFLLNPIAIGVLVLAALALVLSIAGQRRAIWLPGVGALALLGWGLVNAEGGAGASLAANWPWFAMFAGAILIVLAGVQEAQRGRTT